MPKVGGNQKDPHLKSPFLKYILIILVVAFLVFVVAPKVVEIYNTNLNDTNERAENS